MVSPIKKRSVHFIVVILYGLLCFFSSAQFSRGGYVIFDLLQRSFKVEHSNQVALILVDQQSVNNMSEYDGINFPWPREYYTAVTAVANELKAKALFIDILFTERSSYGPLDDQRLAESFKQSKTPIFLPAGAVEGREIPPVSPLKESITAFGIAHFPPSSDGVYRKIPPSLQSRATIPYLMAQTLNIAKPMNINEFVEFYSNPITTIPFYNVIRAYRSLSDNQPLPTDILNLKDKIWMVGYSAPGLMDLRPTPINAKTPGVFVHATGLLNLLKGDGLSNASSTFYLIIGFFIGVGLIILGRIYKKLFPTLISMVGFAFLVPFLFTTIFWQLSLWFNPLPLIATSFLLSIVLLAYRFKKEWQETIRMAKSLEHSMSKEMLKLVKDGDIDSLRFSEKKEVTILFSDIAGFTDISEQLPPDHLVSMLNEYCEDVVEHIFVHHGYIDKFIGDAVMAVWGAPLPQEDHSNLGLKAALKYQEVLQHLNDKISKKNLPLPKLSARVGLHSGEVTVGNIGSSQRFNYTVIGDAVNLASRLEGIGKYYHCLVTISEDTLLKSGKIDEPDIMIVDEIMVKGKHHPTKIFTTINDNEREAAQNYKQGFHLYQQQKFSEALTEFQKCSQIGPAKIMLERCEQILKNGTPENYLNGVWKHETK